MRWMADLAQDVRYGARGMRRTPGFTAVVCVTLALGVGANSALFSLVNVLWRDLPVSNPERLVQFTYQYPRDPPLNFFRLQDYERFRDGNDVFSDVFGTAPRTLPSDAGEAEPLNTEWVTGNFFAALGVRPALGRVLGPGDTEAGASPVAVVSWTYWKHQFNFDPKVLSAEIAVEGISARVVGVTAEEFSGVLTGYRTDVWIPVTVHPKSREGTLSLMARLKNGESIEHARAQMRLLDRARIEDLGRHDPTWLSVTLDVESARSGLSTPLHQQFGQPLLSAMALVAALLLLTCINIGSMLLARAAARQREMAVRVSLGANRFRIVRQVLAESLLLSLAGSLVGIIGAYFGAAALVRIVTSGTRVVGAAPRLDVPIDGGVLLFTAAVAVLASIVFGLAPAWMALVATPVSQLRVAGASTRSPSGRVFGNGLVVAQVALSLALLSVAGLYVRHLSALRNHELGFDRTSVLLVRLDTARATYNRDQLAQLYKELLTRFEAIPGVRSATVSGMTPISGAAGSRFLTAEGFDEAPEARRRVSLNDVAPKYFETFGTPLVAGRDFEFADEGAGRVAIVNQAMARHYFAGRDPIGRHVLLEGATEPHRVVGVVADAKYSDLRIPAPATIYLHAFQQSRLPSQFVLRTSVPPTRIAAGVRHIVDEVLKGVSVRRISTLTEQLDASIVPERLIATVSGFFGGLGLLLAAIGLYGLLAFTVARRTSEIGIRMALGATRRDVTRLVLEHAILLVCLGLAAGVPLATAAKRLAAGMLGGVSAEAALPLVIAALVTIGVGLAAAYVPARRATRVEPLIALRSE